MTVKMAAYFCKTWLMVVVLFIFPVPVAAQGGLCDQDWYFHGPSSSCIRLHKMESLFRDAEDYCKRIKPGGHLVYIFDKDTDDFVKGLLHASDVMFAFIGLTYASQSGVYTWGTRGQALGNYTGWAKHFNIPDSSHYVTAVIMTKPGWVKFPNVSSPSFFCQYPADLPIPRIACPAAEEGTQSPDVVCSVDTRDEVTISRVSFLKDNEEVASCIADQCSPVSGYQAGMSSQSSWSLKIQHVEIGDEAGWTCSVKYNNITSPATSQPCGLGVYRKPTYVHCNYTFDKSEIEVTCCATQVYPHAHCMFVVWRDRQRVQPVPPIIPMSEHDSDYCDLVCTSVFDASVAGSYNVTISAVLEVTGIDRSKAVTTVNMNVLVVPPESSPRLYTPPLTSTWLEVTENETLNITCEVPGGHPPVYRTVIECDRIPGTFQAEGPSVSMNVLASRNFHGGTCTCRGYHAVSSYKKTSSLEIRVRSSTAAPLEVNVVTIVTVAVVASGVVLASLSVAVIIVTWRRRQQRQRQGECGRDYQMLNERKLNKENEYSKLAESSTSVPSLGFSPTVTSTSVNQEHVNEEVL